MKPKYPGVEEAEKQRYVTSVEIEEDPDWKAGAPNYEKWPSKSPEEVLAWLNVDQKSEVQEK